MSSTLLSGIEPRQNCRRSFNSNCDIDCATAADELTPYQHGILKVKFRFRMFISLHTPAISAMISRNMSIPFKKIFSFKNSLWSCNNMGVLFIGENPKAGMPTSRKYLESVPAGKTLGTISKLCLFYVSTFSYYISVAGTNQFLINQI